MQELHNWQDDERHIDGERPLCHTICMPKQRREVDAFQRLMQHVLATDLVFCLGHMDCRYDEAGKEEFGPVSQHLVYPATYVSMNDAKPMLLLDEHALQVSQNPVCIPFVCMPHDKPVAHV